MRTITHGARAIPWGHHAQRPVREEVTAKSPASWSDKNRGRIPENGGRRTFSVRRRRRAPAGASYALDWSPILEREISSWEDQDHEAAPCRVAPRNGAGIDRRRGAGVDSGGDRTSGFPLVVLAESESGADPARGRDRQRIAMVRASREWQHHLVLRG